MFSNLIQKNDKENKMPFLCDISRKQKVKEVCEMHLTCDQNKKCKRQSKVTEKTNEEFETHLVAEEKA